MNGDDTTAIPGSLDKKYRTIRAALNDATALNMIYVFPGVFVTTITNSNDYMWKINVPIYLSANSEFRIDFIGITSSKIFDTSSIYQGIVSDVNIYGDGKLTLFNPSNNEVEILLPQTFNINLDLIEFLNVYLYLPVSNRLTTGQSYNIDITSNKMNTSTGVIWIENRNAGSGKNNLNVNIKELNISYFTLLSTMVFKLDNTGDLNANFNIGKIYYSKNNTINGLFAFHNNFHTTTINLKTHVHNRTSDSAAIITTNQEGCYKNIDLTVDCYCQIWNNINTSDYATDTFQEKGYVKISGLVDLTELNGGTGKSNISLIDFDCHASKLHFDLDLTINTTRLSTIFNCTGNEGQYIVTGNIDYLEQASITGDRSVFEFGSYNSLISTKQPLFKDLLIIMRTLGTAPNYIASFAKNSLLGNNELRLLNCSSSHGLALANGGITELFASPQGQLFVNTNIQ